MKKDGVLKVLLIDGNYMSAMHMRKLIDWENNNFSLTVEYVDVSGMQMLKRLSPDILILHDNTTYIDMEIYINTAIQQNWYIKIILLLDAAPGDIKFSYDHIVSIIPSDVSADILLKELEMTKYLIQEHGKEMLIGSTQKNSLSDFEQMNQMIQTISEREHYYVLRIVSLDGHSRGIDDALLEKSISNILQDYNCGWFQEQSGGVSILIRDLGQKSALYSVHLFWQTIQSLLDNLKTLNIFKDSKIYAFVTSSAPKNQILQGYESLFSLNNYTYFCKETTILTYDYIKMNRKKVNVDVLNTLLNKITFHLLEGKEVEVIQLLEEIYLLILKKSLDFNGLNYTRTCLVDILQLVKAISQNKVLLIEPDFKKEFIFLEQELEYTMNVFLEMLRSLSLNRKIKEKSIQAIKIIVNNFMNDISLDYVAEQLQVTNSYLSRIFKEDLDIGIVDFINQTRIMKAKELITSGDESITNIAKSVGFQDPKYFSRVFKKLSGVAPSEFIKGRFTDD